MASVFLCLWLPWWLPWLVNSEMEWPLPRQVSGRGDLIVTKECRVGVCHSSTGSPVRQNRSVARGGRERPRKSPQGCVDLEQSRHASLATHHNRKFHTSPRHRPWQLRDVGVWSCRAKCEFGPTADAVEREVENRFGEGAILVVSGGKLDWNEGPELKQKNKSDREEEPRRLRWQWSIENHGRWCLLAHHPWPSFQRGTLERKHRLSSAIAHQEKREGSRR